MSPKAASLLWARVSCLPRVLAQASDEEGEMGGGGGGDDLGGRH